MGVKKTSTKSTKKAVKKATSGAAKKSVPKKAVAKKTAVKKGTAKKAVIKKTIAKKVTKKVTVKKATAAKVSTKKAVKKVVKKAVKPKVAVKAVAESEIKTLGLEEAALSTSQPVQQERESLPSPENESFHDMGQYWQDKYEEDRIVLLIRDPYWCFAYWDFSPSLQSSLIQELQNQGQTKLVLRLYDVTDIEFNGSNAHKSMDIEINEEAANWYINVWEADRSYCVELGLLYNDGNFKALLRSNVITTPRDSISPVVDEEWMVVDEMFDQLYQTAGAAEMGRSSEAITKYMLKRVRADVTSGGIASMGSEGGRPKPANPEDFWLVVHTELIVYGATEPNAKLSIQGQPMPLNSDGTFSVRYALPDGRQTIAVRAVNEGGTQERAITPIVEKNTE